MKERIPLCVPNLGDAEKAAVAEAVASGWVSYVGPQVRAFEQALAHQAGAAHAVVMASGTAALHMALVIAGVGAGDEVIMPALTFVAPTNAVKYVGATPVFVDVKVDDWQPDAREARRFLELHCERDAGGGWRNRETGRRIRALMPVHLLGGVVDVEAWAALAREYGLWLIEDAAEAMGATSQGRRIGQALGDDLDGRRMVCTSFNGNKIITTGGGGALFSNCPDIARRAIHLSTTAKTNALEFDHDEVGYNYRLTNIAASLGMAQLARLPEFLRTKRRIAVAYREGVKDLSLTLHPGSANVAEGMSEGGSFWLYTIKLGRDSRLLIQALIAQGIDVRPLWRLGCDLKPHRDGFLFGELPVSRALWTECVSLPSSTGLSAADQDRVIYEVRRFLAG